MSFFTCTDAVFEYEYDLMGNQITSKILSNSGDLLSATYTGYDLNNSPIWKQGANPKNIIYFDYHASGAVKAKRQTLAPSRQMAYTLYEYDPCGNLIEETDPRGYVTYRSYDPLGQIKEETKEGHATYFSYEPGGLVATITSGSGGQVSRYYTTNGLLKEEMYPDGTRNTYVYDFFGRVVLETKNDIVWQIEYDDANSRVIRTHAETQNHEIQQFDARGNLVKFIDAGGYCSEKTYDGLNRLKSHITPSGQQTIWNYQGDCVVCTVASLETTTTRYAAGKPIESQVRDPQGNIIATSQRHFDPQLDKEEIIEGELRTVIWKNSLGLPLRMQKGDITNSYVYDACGNCVQLVDGDGRITYQEFDGLGRLQMRKLPDQNVVLYAYDVDSNLSEYHLPNGNVWKACYDSMKRKTSEKLISSTGSCQEWVFYYEDGYLKTATDPMGRTHTYLYDLYGRISEDSVQGSKRVYTYEPRGFLATARQTKNITTCWLSSWVYGSQTETSFVERSYDADGRVAVESIYLNGQLIEQAKQKWTCNRRSLQIGDHVRDFIYQNNQLVGVSTEQISMKYSYGLDGALKSKDSQLACIRIDYNRSGLPESVFTALPEGSYKEEFEWYSSGKMRRYRGCGKDNNFLYNEQGYLQSTGSEKYDFDAAGCGVRIQAPGWYVPENGLDEFARILHCIFDKSSLMLAYDNIGQVITYGEKQLSWDPWGKLVKITDPSYSWEAFYDPLGRRIQTRYTQSGKATVISNSLYDPDKKFEEIGVQIGQKVFWKIYGPDSCDAISDETGDTVVLIHNGLRQLTGVISSERGYCQQKLPTVYGDVDFSFSVPSDLISYAQSLNWHSKSQDPTGFMWMGDRYYDSRTGQFLSQDPVSYPMCMDLYAYANGDPVNYFDPDGRFASPVYESQKPFVLGDFVEHKISVRDYNPIPAYLAQNNLTRCGFFEQAGFDLPCGAIGFINGINNTREDFMQSIRMLSEYAKGVKVYGIYNATNWDSIRGVSILIDVLECGLNHLGIHTPPVELLKMQWNHFIATHGPDEKFLQFSHSGGALHVYNALMSSPEWVRQRIISVAIAPAAIIPEEICYQSYNYMSKRDFVTRLDIVGNIKYRDELKILEPHQEADFWDHSFLSPTFKYSMEQNINEYIQVFGGRYEVAF